MKYLVALLIFSFVFSANAVTVLSGTVDCSFEIASTRQPTRYEVVKIPTFSVMEKFEYAVESPLLQNRILFGFYPDSRTGKAVSHFAINLTYNTANSGAELPIILDEKFIVVIGRQGSDLIGAFLNCKIQK